MGDESSIIKIGPAPDNKSGNAWDEKGHNNIVQIFISHNTAGINSIQFQHAESENGSLVLSQRHGSNGGNKFDVVKLDYPKEYITWIAGRETTLNSNLLSITFGTNYGEYGPFGSVSGRNKEEYGMFGPVPTRNEEFCFKLGQNRQFHGFHGTTDNKTVRSIGVYLKPNMTLDVSLNNNGVNVL